MADVLGREYRAITAAGFIVRIDDAMLPMARENVLAGTAAVFTASAVPAARSLRDRMPAEAGPVSGTCCVWTFVHTRSIVEPVPGIAVEGFDWDDGNRGKCTAHGLSIEEIEPVFAGPLRAYPDLAHSGQETRYLAIGQSPSGRHVFAAFALREAAGSRRVRPISVRYMHRREIEHYEAQVQKAEEAPGGEDRS